MTVAKPPLSYVLPPLILGTATFNRQYNSDPAQMPYESIVRRALLQHNICAFDTSPYYGPSEILLGDALSKIKAPRSSYMIITKAGRISADVFDYSPSAIRASVHRSLERLHTPYLDLVYAHDVEIVTPAEVLATVRELRRLRDQEGIMQYVGISGYPVEHLASLAEMVLRETGEPLDAVMSYNHFCVQNTRLGDPELLQRFEEAGVDCVPNASMLGMGLLTSRGVDRGPMAAWHPSPPGLRESCYVLKSIAEAEGEHLEEIAIQWSLGHWAEKGARLGTAALAGRGKPTASEEPSRVGVSVMGVSSVDELDETWNAWRTMVGEPRNDGEAQRRIKVTCMVEEKMWPSLGLWKDYAWESGIPQQALPRFSETKPNSLATISIMDHSLSHSMDHPQVPSANTLLEAAAI